MFSFSTALMLLAATLSVVAAPLPLPQDTTAATTDSLATATPSIDPLASSVTDSFLPLATASELHILSDAPLLAMAWSS